MLELIAALRALLGRVGITGAPQDVYLDLLVAGPGTIQGLLRRTRIPPDQLSSALSLLRTLYLVQRQEFRHKERYYATHPGIAWRWRELDAVWATGLTLGSVEQSPPLPDAVHESRRQLMPRLRDASMALFHPSRHTSVTIPRGRAYPDDDEFAYACAEAIILAKESIVAIQKPPMLPHLSLFWSAILDRRAAAVAYRRCVPLSEALVHGCAIVERDIEEVGVQLVFQASHRIRKRLYLIDDRILLFRSNADEGYLAHRPEVVARHKRGADEALADAAHGLEVIAEVRRWAKHRASSVTRGLGVRAADLYLQIIEGGRFADLAVGDGPELGWLVDGGFLSPTWAGGYSACPPTDGFLASFR